MTTEIASDIKTYAMVIGGERVPALSGETFETVSPATNRIIGRVPKADLADVEQAIRAARTAFDSGPWSRFTPLERKRALDRVADILRERIDEIAYLETMNCGKIIVESRNDVTASALCFEYYASLAQHIRGEQLPMNGPLLNYTTREPYGVCAQIEPWNFPLLMVA